MNHSVNDLYGIKKSIVLIKCFENDYVAGDSLCLQARDRVDGDTSTPQDPLPLPVSTDGSPISGGDSLDLSLRTPVLLRDLQSGDGGCCRSVSELAVLSTTEGLEGIDRETQQTQPCHVISIREQADSLQVC